MSKSICLYRCREMARNNNSFSLGPMLEKEKLAANEATLRTGSVILGLSSKLLRRTMFSKKLKGHVPSCLVLVIDDNLYGLMISLSYTLRFVHRQRLNIICWLQG